MYASQELRFYLKKEPPAKPDTDTPAVPRQIESACSSPTLWLGPITHSNVKHRIHAASHDVGPGSAPSYLISRATSHQPAPALGSHWPSQSHHHPRALLQLGLPQPVQWVWQALVCKPRAKILLDFTGPHHTFTHHSPQQQSHLASTRTCSWLALDKSITSSSSGSSAAGAAAAYGSAACAVGMQAK